MENYCIVIAKKITPDRFIEFVKSQGGYWNAHETLRQGVLKRGRARIYVSLDDEISSAGYEGFELEIIERKLGAPPEVFIDVEIGRGEGSKELADEFVRKVLALWGGYFDDNYSDIEV